MGTKPTNRERLAAVIAEIEDVQSDPAIGPTAFGLLDESIAALRHVSRWPLDSAEILAQVKQGARP